MKCPTKQQNSRQQDRRCKSADKRHKTCREDWKKAQDQPQFSNKSNKCLNLQVITGPMIVQQDSNHRHPPLATLLMVQVFTKIIHSFKIILPHSQQSASSVGISTPTLMVNNQPLQTGPQGQQQKQPSPEVPAVSQQANSPIRPHQFNQHF